VKSINYEAAHNVFSIPLLLPLRSKQSLHHPVLNHPQFVFSPFRASEKPSLTPV